MPESASNPVEGPVAAGLRRPGANRGLEGPWVAGVRWLRLNLGHVRLETAPEAGKEGALARWTLAESKAQRFCTA